MHFRHTITIPVFCSVFALSATGFGVATVLASQTYSCPASLTATSTAVVGSTCYAYYQIALSWTSAETACTGMNGHLARIRSADVDNAIASIASTDVWFGASDSNANISGASTGNFFWIGDSAAFWTGGGAGDKVGGAYANWEPGEPNNFGGSEHCALKYSLNDRWNDYVCANGRHYVCELPAIAAGTSDTVAVRSGGHRRNVQELIDQAVAYRNAKKSQNDAPLTASVLVASSQSSSSSSIRSVSSVPSKKVTSAASNVSLATTSLSKDQRIVATANLNLRTDSRIEAHIRRVLHKGYVVTLLNIVDDDWAYVQTKSGFLGYVWRKHLTKEAK